MTRDAISRGVRGAEKLPDMTPREAEALFSAHAAAQKRELARCDMQAWMTGYYVLRAVHAPRQYPGAPCFAQEDAGAMREEDMKAVLARHRKEEQA